MTEWQVVHTTLDINEANIIAGRLHVEGIKSFVHRQAGAAAMGLTIGAWGEINVLVEPEDYERALAILDPDELYALSDNNDSIVYYNHHDDEDDE